MKVSVALCTYNGGSYLEDQLESIARQTLLPYELVAYDDGSTDNTVAILQRFAEHAPFVVRMRVNKHNLGSTANFENAIRSCSGEVIALADQDDVWEPEKLETLLQVLETSSAGAVFSDAEVVDERLTPIGLRLWDAAKFFSARRKRFKQGQKIDVLININVVTGATMAFRARHRDILLPIPKMWVHDGWIALMIAVVDDLVMVDKRLIKYRQHSKNQIGANQMDFLEEISDVQHTDSTREYLEAADRYQAARDRLMSIRRYPKTEHATKLLEQKVGHLHVRAHLPRERWRRLPYILRELVQMRYHKFENGIQTAAGDLLLRKFHG